ncbi:MAG: DUF5816 domain-containing protein [Halorhabdus sp.]
MPADSTTKDGPFQLHCGRCQHVYFQDDWSRTPYCSYHGRETEIRVGDVCPHFEEQSSTATEGEQTTGKRTNDPTAESIEITDDEQLRGVTGPFYAIYVDERKEGWYCSNCESADVTAGPMGRLKCNCCGNIHQSNEWDAGYL